MKKSHCPDKRGRPRVLIVGCGDVGMRILPLLTGNMKAAGLARQRSKPLVYALTSQPERFHELRMAGAVPVLGNLDEPRSLCRLARLADTLIYLAPPPAHGETDTRSRHLAARVSGRCRMVLVSTTGVYGDCGNELVTETRPIRPGQPRSRRRADSEQVWREWARRTGSALSILRVPGIYAANRLPLQRLELRTPALLADQDVMSNHIHADDLARLVVCALRCARPGRIYNAVDHSRLRMGDYFDAIADHFGMARPPRVARGELERRVSPISLSFMSESRMISNERICRELGFRFLYPDVTAGLRLDPLLAGPLPAHKNA